MGHSIRRRDDIQNLGRSNVQDTKLSIGASKFALHRTKLSTVP